MLFITLGASLQLPRLLRNLFPKLGIDFVTKDVTLTLLDMSGGRKPTG
jgi:hypothetical protein